MKLFMQFEDLFHFPHLRANTLFVPPEKYGRFGMDNLMFTL